jgi:hypothetical protein
MHPTTRSQSHSVSTLRTRTPSLILAVNALFWYRKTWPTEHHVASEDQPRRVFQVQAHHESHRFIHIQPARSESLAFACNMDLPTELHTITY